VVAGCHQWNEYGPLEMGGQRVGRRNRKPGLPDPSRAGQGHEPHLGLLEQVNNAGELVAPSDQSRQWRRQVDCPVRNQCRVRWGPHHGRHLDHVMWAGRHLPGPIGWSRKFDGSSICLNYHPSPG
jgi:hypothetical protein